MTDPELGEIRKVFKPGLDNLIAGVIIGVLMLGGGGAVVFFAVKGVIDNGGKLPAWGAKGWSWGAVVLVAALGIGLMVGGFFLIGWMRSLFSLRVHVGQKGFRVTEGKTSRVILWSEIVSVQETHLYERPPLLKGVAKYALPKMMSTSFVVQRKVGEGFGFDGNTISEHEELADMIKEETDSRNIPWEIVEEHQ
jgi:hypothetical protein